MPTPWGRWADWLLASPTPAPESRTNISSTHTSQENRMTSTTDPLNQLHQQLADVDAATEADPIALAEDLDQWSLRDQQRRDHRLQLERQIRDRREYGALLDDEHLAGLVRSYVAAVAEHRTRLHHVATRGHYDEKAGKTPQASDLSKWWTALEQLGRDLPDYEPDAVRFLDQEINRWFRSRDGLAAAIADRAGINIPRPELGDLPGGGRYTYHRVGGAA